MKASVDRQATREVLAAIEDAVRPVELARTSAAAERVLRTATPSTEGPASGSAMFTFDLAHELGVTPVMFDHLGCDCLFESGIEFDNLGDWFEVSYAATSGRYAPWVVSPHLFEGVDR